MLWSEVSGECSDPVIYKLADIQQLIANLTAKQERQELNLTYCTAQLQSYRDQLEEQAGQLKKQVRNSKLNTKENEQSENRNALIVINI